MRIFNVPNKGLNGTFVQQVTVTVRLSYNATDVGELLWSVEEHGLHRMNVWRSRTIVRVRGNVERVLLVASVAFKPIYQVAKTFNDRFYRATRMHSADYAVARCLSVRPSVTRRYSVETALSKFFVG